MDEEKSFDDELVNLLSWVNVGITDRIAGEEIVEEQERTRLFFKRCLDKELVTEVIARIIDGEGDWSYAKQVEEKLGITKKELEEALGY